MSGLPQSTVSLSDREKRRLLAERLRQKNKPRFVSPSFAQQRLWFLDRLMPGSSAYNVPWALRLRGHLDVAALEAALNEIVRRHETLRSTFVTVSGRPVQVVSPEMRVTVKVTDLQEMDGAERERVAGQRISQEARQSFDLQADALFRVRLVRLAEEDHILVLVMHHIISDGWSMGVLLRELENLYAAFRMGLSSPLAELPIQYADYAVWQREWLSGEVLEEQLRYWSGQLAGVETLELPADRPRPAVFSGRGRTVQRTLPAALVEKVRELCRREGVTPFMLMLAGFEALLYRYTGQEDIVVGTAVANRNRVEIEPLIGFFVNTLALRTAVTGELCFRELLARVRETTLGAYDHQDLPFEKLVEVLQPKRYLSHTPLIQVMFVLENVPLQPPDLSGLQVTDIPLDTGGSRFDLSLYLMETPGDMRVTAEYNTDLFEQERIERMLGHYERLLEAAIADSQMTVNRLPLLGQAEWRQVVETWNQTFRPYPQGCIHELFDDQVARTPEAVAAVYGKQALTYRELEERANRLAHYLQRMGVGPEQLVGICIERSLEMVVGILGILKAGGAYVPLDPAYPRERLSWILEDAQIPVLLTQKKLLAKLPEHQATAICLDDWGQIAQESEPTLRSLVGHTNLAYVLYTSGSTGKPKGVAIEHHSAFNFLHWAREAFTSEELANVLAATSICFDLSVFELFAPLSRGGTVVLADNILQLPELPAAGKVTLINTVPSAMAELLRMSGLPDSIRTVNLAGEPLQNALVQQLYEKTKVGRVFNLYGPTETTTYSTYTLIERGATGSPSIGHPIANTQVLLLDRSLTPVPLGVAGEVYLGGDGVARGYLRQPELSADRFISNPFGPGRLYRTGDLARYLADGNLEYLGRLDFQVKVRGFRIELGEIEAVLGTHPAVREVVVVARSITAGDKRLVAYLVPKEKSALSPADLRSFVRDRLPEFMVPSAYVILRVLPQTPNGKIDRLALPDPDASAIVSTDTFVSPRNRREESLANIWAGVLGVDRVGVYDDFFELGGHSLLATQVVSAVKQTFDITLPVQTVFERRTIAELTMVVEEAMLRAAHPQEVDRILTDLGVVLNV